MEKVSVMSHLLAEKNASLSRHLSSQRICNSWIGICTRYVLLNSQKKKFGSTATWRSESATAFSTVFRPRQ